MIKLFYYRNQAKMCHRLPDCKYGSNCRYPHTEEQFQIMDNYYKKVYKKYPCENYLKLGFCSFGPLLWRINKTFIRPLFKVMLKNIIEKKIKKSLKFTNLLKTYNFFKKFIEIFGNSIYFLKILIKIQIKIITNFS